MKLPKHQEAHARDGIVELPLWYPRNDGANHTIEIGLVDDARFAASIRITYDFKRNGWVILQVPPLSSLSPDWKEVGFFHEAGPSEEAG